MAIHPIQPDSFGLGPVIICAAAWKGGVGKTLLAYELAYLLGGVLVDLDWDAGGATKQWGYRPEERLRAPLLDGFETGKTPKPLTGTGKPRLIPSHPDLAVNQPSADRVTECLVTWARELGVPLIVDTHPGGVPTTYGALAAAKVIPTPVILGTRELAAAEAIVTELPDYPLLIVPNKVPGSPPAAELTRLEKLAAGFPVAPPISEHRWYSTRKIRVAVTAYGDQESARVGRLAGELRAVATEVVRHAR